MALTLPVATHERLEHLERPMLPRNAIEALDAGSIAAEAGLQIGDVVLSVNGHPLTDVVDWRFYSAAEEVSLAVKRNEELLNFALEKGFDEPLGITFAEDLFDRMHICKNKCVFCFLYQQPKGLRPSLYVKDDDFRLSFLHSNYVTLTNLKPGELDRICEQRLSPLYVSVHATDPEARGKILGRRGPEPILEILEKLVEARIQIHAQVVLVPHYNDGEVFFQTITDLAKLHPKARGAFGGVISVAVVPIGITQFRERLAPVETWTGEQKAWWVNELEPLRTWYLKELGTRFVYLSDEFYLGGGLPIPARSHYEGFPQLEDGIGLVRLFLDECEKLKRDLPKRAPKPRKVTFATGEIAGPLLTQLAEIFNKVEGLEINVCAIHNKFFEGNINIAGLIVGRDLINALKAFPELGDEILIPNVMLRDGTEVFLDEMTLEQVNQEVGRPIVAIDRTPAAAAAFLLAL
jgi:putative radical SAM enzyme (TIGR03279 family)